MYCMAEVEEELPVPSFTNASEGKGSFFMERLHTVNVQTQHEVAQVLLLRREFYQANGLEEDTRRQSYEPPVARANYERRVLALPQTQQQEAKEAFLCEERQNLQKALGERYMTSKSINQYQLIDRELYSPDFPDEPFTRVIQRGREFCQKIDSREVKREFLEEAGIVKLQKAIENKTNPIGTQIIMISPPGIVEDTMYPKRFVDIWEIKEHSDGRRYGEVTRFTTNLTYDGYKKGARNIRPDYFHEWYTRNEHATEEEKIPIDAWIVGHPIQLGQEYQEKGVEEIFDTFFAMDYGVMQEKMFEEVLLVCWPLAEYYLRELCKGERDFVSIAESFHAILARADAFIKDKETYGDAKNAHAVIRETQNSGLDIRAQMHHWSQQEVTVRSTNCGDSKGFKRNKFGQIMISYGFESPQEALLNSVASKVLDTEESEKITWADGICRLCEKEDHDSSTKRVGDCNVCEKHQAEFDSGKRK